MTSLIRPAVDHDVAGITDIYNDVVMTTTAMWEDAVTSVDERQAWRERLVGDGYPLLVADQPGAGVVGYACYGAFRARSGYRATVEHSVHVRAGWRGQGIGRDLMAALIAAARSDDRHVMIAAMDATNEGSVVFHRRFGFEEVARLPEVGRKLGEWRTLVLMELLLDS